MRSLLGTLNLLDAEQISENIDRLLGDQRKMIHLESERSHLLNRKMGNIIFWSKTFRDSLTHQIEQLKNSTKDYQELNEHLWKTVATQERIFRRSERILNILKDLIRGEIHPTLLTHEFAKQIVKDILSNGFDLETYQDNNQVSHMDLILGGQVDAIYHPSRVIISILVPIVDKRVFTLYKTHSIENPQRISNVTASIAYLLIVTLGSAMIYKITLRLTKKC